MPQKQSPTQWRRLDNAAKIFPSTSGGRDTNVFRFTCALTAPVDPAHLQTALDRTVKTFPHFVCTLRHGLFWHYLEQTDRRPMVHEECYTPCISIYSADKQRLLFYVSYYKNRINLEMFHALSDGTGALELFRALVFEYLCTAYPDKLSDAAPPRFDAALSQRAEDSFTKYYTPGKAQHRLRSPHAYQIKGPLTDDYRYRIFEGLCDTDAALALARRHGTTLTVLLCAFYLKAVEMTMSSAAKKRPVVLTVPLNLRHYYPSVTTNNFFSTMRIPYHFKTRDGSLEDIIAQVDAAFKKELTQDAVAARMNALIALQQNYLLRIAPLAFKNFVLKIAKKISDKGETAVVSNVGKIDMPAQATPYIEHFSVFSSSENMHLCICSHNNRLSMSLCSSLLSSDIEREFFRALTRAGIRVTLHTNYDQD